VRLFGRREFKPYRFQDLAVYNSERARGLVHTPEYQEKMKREQELFNAYHEGLVFSPDEVRMGFGVTRPSTPDTGKRSL